MCTSLKTPVRQRLLPVPEVNSDFCFHEGDRSFCWMCGLWSLWATSSRFEVMTKRALPPFQGRSATTKFGFRVWWLHGELYIDTFVMHLRHRVVSCCGSPAPTQAHLKSQERPRSVLCNFFSDMFSCVCVISTFMFLSLYYCDYPSLQVLHIII